MDLMQLRRQMMGVIASQSGGDVLPNGYTRVKCLIKSTGTNYINTGVPLGTKMYIKDLDYEVTYTGASSVSLFGARSGGTANDNKFAIWVNNNGYKPALNCGSLDTGFITSVTATGRHKIATSAFPNVKVYFDDAEVYNATPTRDNDGSFKGNLFIFDINHIGSPQGRGLKMKLYGITIADDSGDLFRAVPVIRNVDSEPGLYDFVTKSFFGKADANKDDFTYETL